MSEQAKNLTLQCFPKSQKANCARSTLHYPTNLFSFALVLIGFTVQNAEVCFAFPPPPEVPNSNCESDGVLGSCSVFSRIPTEIPHLPTYFYRKPIKKQKRKFSYSIGTTSNFKMTFLMYFFVKYYVV